MRLQLFNAEAEGKPLKVTIQSTGRLGFTELTANKLALDTNTFFLFYVDEDKPDKPIVQILRMEDKAAFRVMKSGQYFYLPTAAFFQRLGFDYQSGNIICDLHDDPEARQELQSPDVYRLIPRPVKKSRKTTSLQQ